MNQFTNFDFEQDDQREVLPVSRLLRRMRNVLEIEVGELWVEGEVSNLRKQGSGHWYFSLKDEGGQIACAMFGARRRVGSDVLEDGAKVRVFGEVTIYEARGTAQLVVREVEAVGVGSLQAQFEALKRKLDAEGLFSQELKKPLPKFPTRIGVVTSGSSAALQDMITVLSRRAPWVTVYLYDVQVQGRGAEHGIANAIRQLGNKQDSRYAKCEVLIVGRGGGSMEDLWNFNEEIVARAIAECPIPVVSAVGHEIDFTIADFVSDLRAPTPSAAAELVVPDQEELSVRINKFGEHMRKRASQAIERREELLNYLKKTSIGLTPESTLREPVTRLDDMSDRLERVLMQGLKLRVRSARELAGRWRLNRPEAVMGRRQDTVNALYARQLKALESALDKKVATLEALAGLVKALGPESAFERGFSITLDDKGKVLKEASMAKKGMRLETMMKGGVVPSRVE